MSFTISYKTFIVNIVDCLFELDQWGEFGAGLALCLTNSRWSECLETCLEIIKIVAITFGDVS